MTGQGLRGYWTFPGPFQAFKTWLAERPESWRDKVEVVAMDGFIGFETATSEELCEAVAVMEPFYVVRLAGEALDQCRRRVQQLIHGHRGPPATRSTAPAAPCTPAPSCSPTDLIGVQQRRE